MFSDWLDLVGIVLGVVQGGVAAGVDPVDDGPHGGLDVGAGVAQQHEHRLLVVAAAGLAVHHDLVIVARLDQTFNAFIFIKIIITFSAIWKIVCPNLVLIRNLLLLNTGGMEWKHYI